MRRPLAAATLPALFATLLALTSTPPADGKAAFLGKAEMIAKADAVAVVRVTRAEVAEVKGEHWTYQQRAFAEVETVLKGDLPKELVLHGDENFICARCRFEPGRHVVFLKRDGGLWAGVNWHLSVRTIAEGDNVEWFPDDRGIETKPTPLADVLAEVKRLAERAGD